MQYNCAGGQDHLESSVKRSVTAKVGPQTRDEWRAQATILSATAACAIHGCCDGDCVEEYERWDGMA
jgi:hypothetical protein